MKKSLLAFWLFAMALFAGLAHAQLVIPPGVVFGLDADKTLLTGPSIHYGEVGCHVFAYSRDSAGNVFTPGRSGLLSSCPLLPGAFLDKLRALSKAPDPVAAYKLADAATKPCDLEQRAQCTSLGALCREFHTLVLAEWPVGKPLWKPLGVEGDTFTATGKVRYGTETAWVEKIAAGDGACTNAWFGRDPAIGVVKVCAILTGDLQRKPDPDPANTCSAPPPPPAPTHVVAAATRVDGTRPAYNFVDGKRTTQVTPGATAGQPCGPEVFETTTAGTWRLYGPDFKPKVVALCVAKSN